jgi:DNA-directed RNA polymerase subunit alpha
VFLSSLSGAAVTAVKIKGVLHEFSTIPNVKEDIVQIILALKTVHFKMYGQEEIRLSLQFSGAGEAKAKDISKNASVEILNPEVTVATLTSPEAELEMEIFLRQGRGYLSTEEREHEEKEIGKILVDALFSPVLNAGLRVENIRVGEMTNYERLILTVETNGIVTPQEAFKQSVEILIQKFKALLEPPAQAYISEPQKVSEPEPKPAEEVKSEDEPGEEEPEKPIRKKRVKVKE